VVNDAMAKSAELLALKLVAYHRDASGKVFVRPEKGDELVVECDRCGNVTDWLIPPGPKEGLTLICNSCVTTYVYILHPEN
jgi:hypothetical protein